MSRILRALVVSAVATSAAVFATALLHNKDNLTIDKLKAGLAGFAEQHSTGAKADLPTAREGAVPESPVDSLTANEQEMLLDELQDHV